MTKVNIGRILPSVFVIVAAAGCSVIGAPEQHGTLILSFAPRLVASTIEPDGFSMEVHHYVVSGDGPGDEHFVSDSVTGSTFVRTSLEPGEWTITVEAFNGPTDSPPGDGVKIGEGSRTADVDAGEVLQITISVVPLSGTGTLDLAVNWPMNVLTSPAVDATLVPSGENPDPAVHGIDFDPETAQESSTIQVGYVNDEQPTGYYTLSVRLLDEGSTPVWGTVDAVRVIYGQLSDRTFTLVEETNRSGLSLTIEPDLRNPIEIELNVESDVEFIETDEVVVTAGVTGQSVDEWRWYLQGAPISDGDAGVTISTADDSSTATLTDLSPAYYRLSVVARVGQILSSKALDFHVVAASSDPPPSGATSLYWVEQDAQEIRRLSLVDSSVTVIHSGIYRLWYLAIDEASGKLYFSAYQSGRIERSNLDGSGRETIVDDVGNPIDIELDLAGGKIYWADHLNSEIGRADLDGSSRQTVVATGTQVWGIALDTQAGYVYWTEIVSGQRVIRRATLSGTNAEYIRTDLSTPRGLEIDVEGGWLYWPEVTGHIRRTTLDGTTAETLYASDGFAAGLVLDLEGGTMYWADTMQRAIFKANLDGSGVETVHDTGIVSPHGLALAFE